MEMQKGRPGNGGPFCLRPAVSKLACRMTTLITARLTLRGPRPGDLDDLHAIYGDRRAMRYWSSLPHGELDTTQAMLDRMIATFADQPTYFIWERAGRAIGAGGMHDPWEVGSSCTPTIGAMGWRMRPCLRSSSTSGPQPRPRR